MSNLKLWNAVEETEKQFTKYVSQRGGYTAISPQYQLKQATEQFGVYGQGFGLSESEFDYTLIDTGLIIHKAKFFFVIGGQRSEFPITNAIQAVKTTKNGKYVDEDFAKKVETNTVSKALSKLGFNADVYMGLFEDQEYLEELEYKQAIEKASDKDLKKAEIEKELAEEVDRVIVQIKEANSMSMLEGLYKAMARKVKDRAQLLKLLTAAKDAKKEELKDA